jgi:hypothetical protein
LRDLGHVVLLAGFEQPVLLGDEANAVLLREQHHVLVMLGAQIWRVQRAGRGGLNVKGGKTTDDVEGPARCSTKLTVATDAIVQLRMWAWKTRKPNSFSSLCWCGIAPTEGLPIGGWGGLESGRPNPAPRGASDGVLVGEAGNCVE